MKLSVTIILIQHGAFLKRFTSITGLPLRQLKRLMRVLFLPTKTLICCNKRNHDFIFYTLRKTVKIRRRRLTDSVVMTRKEGYDQLVMSRNSSRIKASRKTQGRLLLSCKNPDFFSGLSELFRIFSKMTEFMGVVYMLHRRPHLHCRKQWHMRGSERSHR